MASSDGLIGARLCASSREHPGVIVRILLVGILGSCMSLIMPGVLEQLVRVRGFSVPQVALLASIEMVGMTVAIVAAAPLMSSFDRRKFLAIALALAALGQVGAALTPGYPLFATWRLLAGLGEGAMLASMSAAIAGTTQPDRLFAVYLTSNMLVSMAFLRVLPLLAGNAGIMVIYGSLGLLTALCACCLSAFPRQAPRSLLAPEIQPQGGVLRLLARPQIAASLLGTLVFFIGIGMTWPLMGQLGVSLGHPSAQVAAALANSVVVGAVAGVFTSWLGTRIGRRVPLILSTAGIAGSLLLLVLQGATVSFALATGAFMLAWVVSTAYYMGTIASLDATGRASTLGVAMQCTGLFLGPALAAALIRDGSFRRPLWGGIALCAVAVMAMMIADRLARQLAPRAE
jgi:predicted MFS family arabinose efflux permease